MSVTHGIHGVVTQQLVPAFQTSGKVIVSNGPGRRNTRGPGRPPMSGYRTARLAAASEWHPSDHAFNATAVWRSCNIEGYLERKLHRQWRSRGS